MEFKVGDFVLANIAEIPIMGYVIDAEGDYLEIELPDGETKVVKKDVCTLATPANSYKMEE